jgi:hypothetical protein
MININIYFKHYIIIYYKIRRKNNIIRHVLIFHFLNTNNHDDSIFQLHILYIYILYISVEKSRQNAKFST